MIIIDAFSVFLHGASIYHSVRNHYRCVYGVFAWCFNISQSKKITI